MKQITKTILSVILTFFTFAIFVYLTINYGVSGGYLGISIILLGHVASYFIDNKYYGINILIAAVIFLLLYVFWIRFFFNM